MGKKYRGKTNQIKIKKEGRKINREKRDRV